jgi:hypothetical protein
MINMKYLYFREDGKLWARTKSADSAMESQFPNPIIVGNDYDITIEEDDIVREKTRSEIESELTYSIKRMSEYPSVQDQFDMIYHELTESGSLSASGSWAKSIKSVKDENPKP